MRKTLTVFASSTAAVLMAAGVVAANGQTKTDVCHSHGDGSFDLITVADPALDSHIAHGDAVPGEAVPGLPGFVFNEICEAIPEPVQDPFLRARAWTDADESRNGRYDEGTDFLVAEARDNGDGTVTVTTGSTHDFLFGQGGVPLARIPFLVTEHTGLTGGFNNAGYRVTAGIGEASFTFQSNEFREVYSEVSPSGMYRTTRLLDDLSADGQDSSLIGPDSPSQPDYEDDEIIVNSTGDDPHLQVALFPVTP